MPTMFKSIENLVLSWKIETVEMRKNCILCGRWFSTSLISLEIGDLNITELLFRWGFGFHSIISLKRFVISVGCPHLMLPASLTSLTIAGFPNLKYLSSEASESSPLLKNPSIQNEPVYKNLMSFPEPPSLLPLHIGGRPLLKERCQNDQGREWC
ncbi:hypothetical protein CJ030_MR0G003386 [Morella rubra]|uniref:Uncharacterized protein n=1 Tax=Morella rubra TaxID=262757 RepID=A0A6A1UNP9_9ROSI|nr:hypothetical protein CJ030_MR0G003386 [Morella rubra]